MTDHIVEYLIRVYPSGFSLETLPTVLIDVMSLVGRLKKKLTGTEKKEMVIRILNEVLDKTNSGSYDEILDKVLKVMIPVTIDLFIDVENNKIRINPKIRDTCLNCL